MVFCVSKFQKNGQIYGFHWTLSSSASQLTQLNPKTAKTSTFSITIGMGCRPRYQGLLSPNLELKSLQVHPVFPFFPLFLVRFFSPLPFPILCPLSSLSLSLSLFSSPSRSVTPPLPGDPCPYSSYEVCGIGISFPSGSGRFVVHSELKQSLVISVYIVYTRNKTHPPIFCNGRNLRPPGRPIGISPCVTQQFQVCTA